MRDRSTLFGAMPECKDIVDTMQLMNFLLFDGQANAGKLIKPWNSFLIFHCHLKVLNKNQNSIQIHYKTLDPILKYDLWKTFGSNYEGKTYITCIKDCGQGAI